MTRPATDGNEVRVAGAVAGVDCRLLVGASTAVGRAVTTDGAAVVLSCDAGNSAVSLPHVVRRVMAIEYERTGLTGIAGEDIGAEANDGKKGGGKSWEEHGVAVFGGVGRVEKAQSDLA